MAQERGGGRPDHLAEPGADGDLERHAEHHRQERGEQESPADAEHAGDPADDDPERGDARKPHGVSGDDELRPHARLRWSSRPAGGASAVRTGAPSARTPPP